MAKKLVNPWSFAVVLVVTTLFVFGNVKELNAADLSTTACPGAGCTTFGTAGADSVSIQVTGSFSGTVTFSCSVDNVTYVACEVVPVGDIVTHTTTTTAAGIWKLDLKGIQSVRAAFTSYMSGTAVVTFGSLRN